MICFPMCHEFFFTFHNLATNFTFNCFKSCLNVIFFMDFMFEPTRCTDRPLDGKHPADGHCSRGDESPWNVGHPRNGEKDDLDDHPYPPDNLHDHSCNCTGDSDHLNCLSIKVSSTYK